MSEQNHYIVKVVSYNSKWPLEYEKEKQRLLDILDSNIFTIEHTGSTSIPNQEAKPIIDMFAGVHTLKRFMRTCLVIRVTTMLKPA